MMPPSQYLTCSFGSPLLQRVPVHTDNDYRIAVDDNGRLTAVMANHKRIGGSCAQRDLVEYSLMGALPEQGRSSEAIVLLQTRRPHKVSAHGVEGL